MSRGREFLIEQIEPARYYARYVYCRGFAQRRQPEGGRSLALNLPRQKTIHALPQRLVYLEVPRVLRRQTYLERWEVCNSSLSSGGWKGYICLPVKQLFREEEGVGKRGWYLFQVVEDV